MQARIASTPENGPSRVDVSGRAGVNGFAASRGGDALRFAWSDLEVELASLALRPDGEAGRPVPPRIEIAAVRLREPTLAAVRRADRVWLGTDALGTDEFLGRVGTGALVERAKELGVLTTVLATTDKLTPGGDLKLPDWASGEAWHLWESAPKDVEVEAQPFEPVGLEWVNGVATEVGLMLPGDLRDAPLRAI